jgi:PPOX class probable F420-dependent enzyme
LDGRFLYYAAHPATESKAYSKVIYLRVHQDGHFRTELSVTATIPGTYLDLVNGPRVAALTTIMPDGQPQTTVVWCDFDGTYVRVNTMRGFRKEKNMRGNPRVTLLCFDPRQPLRSLEIRGVVVEMTEIDALEHLDGLSQLYTGRTPYFGECVAAELRQIEFPVLCKIQPVHVVTLDARDTKETAR